MTREQTDHRWVHIVEQDVFLRKSAIIKVSAGREDIGSVLFMEDGKTHYVPGITPEDFFNAYLKDFGLSPEELIGE